MIKIKKIFTHNAPLKIVSLLLGYSFWFIFGHAQIITSNITVPLCFYGVDESFTIQAPETVHIELSGKRSIMQAMDMQSIAVHIDARELVDGIQPIEISSERLFLPESIKLVHYSPAQIVVNVKHEEIKVDQVQL